MAKILIPEAKGKQKTKARGFWYSQENKKTFYDYLKVVNYKLSIDGFYYRDLFSKYLNTIKECYSQEAIAFINKNVMGIYSGQDKIEILPNRIYSEVIKGNLKKEIKEALRVYGGVTIYIEAGRYYKEIYFKSEV